MGDRLYPYVEKAVERYAEETGDKDSVFAIRLPQQNGSNGYSADWHPSVATHEATAKAVVRELKKILG